MIQLDHVSKSYPDGATAVDGLSLDIPKGKVTVLIGPSGCGKTTTLKMINRLVEPTSGGIRVGGVDVMSTDRVQLRRTIGYVIQTSGLFPHRSVRHNVATVPRLLGWDKRRTTARVDEMLDLVGLEPEVFAKRYPHQLSGGQRQRVGVARALAADPPVLLMDEPFAAVDPVQRGRLQAEFRRLQDDLRKTVVLVTHDIEEAVRLGDRIAVLRQGAQLAQFDPPATLLGAPSSPFVADFLGDDRLVTRLEVTRLRRQDVVPVASGGDRVERSVTPSGEDGDSLVRVGDSLRRVLQLLMSSTGPAVDVVDAAENGRVIGQMTPGALFEAIRGSLDRDLAEAASSSSAGVP
jgi:osmoprotectant transport system ATP-binding protein